MPKLYILSGPDLGRTVEITPGVVMGRSPTCAVHLRHTSVSREHARVDCTDGRWTLVDLGSRNGITLRGERVTTAVLADGDEFVVGEVLLRFRNAAPAVEAAQPASAASAPVPAHDDELELEGDWDTQTLDARLPPSAPAPVHAAPRGPSPIATPLERRAPEAPAPIGARSRAQAMRASMAVVGERSVLQYQRVQERPGFFGSDLGQQPLVVRMCVALGAIAAFAAVFWLAYKGTLLLKAKAHGDAPIVHQEPGR